MLQYGRGSGARAGGAAGRSTTVDQLRKSTDLALRQIKKLRKYELEQASPLLCVLLLYLMIVFERGEAMYRTSCRRSASLRFFGKTVL